MVWVIIAIVIIAIIIAGIHDASPEAEKKYNAQSLRSIGVDPDSAQGQMIMANANVAKLNEQIQKKEQRKETAKIITGAVVGDIVGGGAGAVVGAMVAKNKIDNSKNCSTTGVVTPVSVPSVYTNPEPQNAHYNQADAEIPVKQETKKPPTRSSISRGDYMVEDSYKNMEWERGFEYLKNNRSWRKGDIAKDVKYCLSLLEIVQTYDLCNILDEELGAVRRQLTQLMEDGTVIRIVYKGKPYFMKAYPGETQV